MIPKVQWDLGLEIVQAIIGLAYHGLRINFGPCASVFGIIVLLEEDALGPVIKCKAALQVILQNLNVKDPINPPINPASISNLLEQHTAPNHQISSSKLQASFCQSNIQPV